MLRGPRLLPFVPALFLLAVQPAIWLVRSWFDPGYDSDGEWIFLLAAGLLAASARSKRLAPTPARHLRTALWLEFGTAAIRVAGELLAVRTIGALALVVDVYALGLGLGLGHRRRSLSPVGLALLFSLSLPVERLIQRGLGYPMQLLSARGACAVLEPLHPGLTCTGTLISLEGAALSVDLPCSGARGLVLLGALFFALLALRRFRVSRIPVAAVVVVTGAFLSNALRLVLLAEGLLLGLDVTSEPLHSIVGLLCIAVAALGLLATTRSSQRQQELTIRLDTPERLPRSRGRLAPAALLAAALCIFVVPTKPVDVSAAVPPISLPASLGEYDSEALALSAQETAYFTQFGGAAAKRRYWSGRLPHTVVMVRTRAPLRHLHAPDECLIGAGHRVRLLGVRAADATSVYKSEAPDGSVWRVDVSFVSDASERATNPAEVAWRWIQSPDTTWTMVQRITPWAVCEVDAARCATFDRHLFSALQEEIR